MEEDAPTRWWAPAGWMAGGGRVGQQRRNQECGVQPPGRDRRGGRVGCEGRAPPTVWRERGEEPELTAVFWENQEALAFRDVCAEENDPGTV